MFLPLAGQRRPCCWNPLGHFREKQQDQSHTGGQSRPDTQILLYINSADSVQHIRETLVLFPLLCLPLLKPEDGKLQDFSSSLVATRDPIAVHFMFRVT